MINLSQERFELLEGEPCLSFEKGKVLAKVFKL